MTGGQKTLAALLSITAILLALNLLAPAGRAFGQSPGAAEEVSPPPVPISITAVREDLITGAHRSRWLVFRLWSDGAVDVNHVGGQDVMLEQPCEGQRSLTQRSECFTGWKTIR